MAGRRPLPPVAAVASGYECMELEAGDAAAVAELAQVDLGLTAQRDDGISAAAGSRTGRAPEPILVVT